MGVSALCNEIIHQEKTLHLSHICLRVIEGVTLGAVSVTRLIYYKQMGDRLDRHL